MSSRKTKTIISHTNLERSLSASEMMEEYKKCEQDFFYFATHYCYTIDNEKQEIKLIPDWDYLRDLAAKLQNGEKHIALKKSRRMIVSWLMMAFALWCITFKKSFPVLILSRKEQLVDDGGESSTPNSLLGKVRFIYDRLKPWVKKTIIFSHLKVQCEKTGSFIIGESSNPDAGRGGGYAIGIIDEAAFIEHGETVFAAFSRACKRMILVSTSNGPKTMFARLCNLAQKEEIDNWEYIFLHALMRPDRNADYIAECKAEMKPDQFAREIEGKDVGENTALVWSMFSIEKHVKENLLDSNLPIELSFDFGVADPTAIKFIQHVNNEMRIVGELEIRNSTPKQIVEQIVAWLREHKFIKSMSETQMNLDEYNKYVKNYLSKLRCFGDPAGHSKMLDGSNSLIAQYAELGINIQTTNQSDVQIGILEIIKRLNAMKLFVDKSCTLTIDELAYTHYQVNSRTGQIFSGTKYAHDQYSHGADAMRYWAENNPLPAVIEEPNPENVVLNNILTKKYNNKNNAGLFKSRLPR